MRWDYAFYQMILETGALSYRNGSRSGDVKPTQNNFAGLGATGRGEPGESFKDVRDRRARPSRAPPALFRREAREPDRRAHAQGAGMGRADQLAGPLRPAHHFRRSGRQVGARQRQLLRMLEGIAERFDAFCARPDPRPELVAEARGRTNVAEAKPERPSGAEFAKRAIEEGKADDLERRSTLGALPRPGEQPDGQDAARALQDPQRAAGAREAGGRAAGGRAASLAAATTRTPQRKTKPKTTASIAPTHAQDDRPATSRPTRWHRRPARPSWLRRAAATGQKCRVWTASYGGQKALIIKSVVDKVVNYTVLDVNEGAEKREADAFISAYAKEGAVAGEYGNQSQALDKAFELCPEG